MSSTTIHGRLTSLEDSPGELRVELRRRDGALVATAAPSPEGDFHMVGLDVAPQRRHELVLEVHRGGLLVERVPVAPQRWGAEIETELELDERAWSDNPVYRVRGQLRDADGKPLPGKRIEVVDRDLRAEQRLAETTTGRHGLYCAEYRREQFVRDEKGSADVVVRARDPKRPRGKPLAESGTVFNAGRVEVIDLMVGGGTWQGPSEFERVQDAVAPLMRKVKPASVKADEMSFLSGETGIAPDEVEAYVHALAAQRGRTFTADALYGLLRSGLPATIPELAQVDGGVIRARLIAALDGNVVPLSVRPRIDAIAAALQAERTARIADGTDTRSPIGAVAGAVLATRQERERLIQLSIENPGDDQLWAAVKKDKSLRPQLDTLRFAAEVTGIVGAFPPLVKALVSLHESGELSGTSDLASYDEAAWRSLLSKGRKPIGAPPGTPGSKPATRINAYAKTLTNTIAAAMPTKSIAAGIAAQAKGSPVGAFLDKHPQFAFGQTTVDGFIAEHAPKTDAKTVAELKEVERLSKISPLYDHIAALREAGLGSSRAITTSGKESFAKDFGSKFGSKELAEVAWERAAWLNAAAQHLVAATAPIFQLPLNVLNNQPAPENPAIPDWDLLFGSLEMCDCEQCRTVISPAAYFTDLLHFLSQRVATSGNTPLDVLLSRRPDLAEIELTCDNTNIPLPYIDLVNELLEREVAPQQFGVSAGQQQLNSGTLPAAARESFATAGFPLTDAAKLGTVVGGHLWWVRDRGIRHAIRWNTNRNRAEATPYPQTSGTAEELSANPEHVNDKAYDKLARAIFPWSLPFDLPFEQTTAFVGRMGITRDELMRRYRSTGATPTPSDAAIAAAAIGLSDEERQIVAGSHSSSSKPWLFWGASAPASGTDWAAQLQPVSTLLQRARLDYGQLADLLELVFLNPQAKFLIEPVSGANPETCDTTKLAISNLTGAALDRIHRFIRLQRRLGWSARDLDRVLGGLKAAQLDDGVVRTTSDIERLRRALGVPVQRIVAWYAPIDTAAYQPSPIDATKSLYAQLFQNPSVVKRRAGSDPFALTAAGELAAQQPLVVTAAGANPDSVTQIRAAIAGALGISADDLTLLLDGPDAVAGANPKLTVETLSRLFRRVSLARAMKLKVPDLLTLVRLTGIDPFVDTSATFALRDALATIKATRLPIAQVAYLLRGEVPAGSSVAPSEQSLATTLTGLRSGLNATRLATTPAPDPQGQLTAAALVALGWDDATVQAAVNMLAGTAVYTQSLATLPTAVTLPSNVPVSYDNGQLTYTGPMTLADRQTLDGLSNNTAYKAAVKGLFDAPRDLVEKAMKTFVAPVYTEPLAALDPSVQFPADVSSYVSYDADAGVLSFLGTMTAAQQAELLGLSNDQDYQDAVNALFAAPDSYVPPAENAFLAAADASALFDTATDPSARFAYVLPRLYGYIRATRSSALLQQTFIQALRLEPDMVSTLLHDWADQGPGSPHHPADDFLDDGFVTSADAMTRVRFPEAFATLTRLLKMARIVTSLSIPAGDLAALIAHSDAAHASWLGLLDFATLPVHDGDAPASFATWAALADLFLWEQQLPESSSPSLLGLLAEAAAYDPANTTVTAAKTAMIDAWVKLTDWSKADLEALIGPGAQPGNRGLLGYALPRRPHFPPNAPLPTNKFSLIATWKRIRDAMDAAAMLGATCSLCGAWAQPSPSAADALAVQQAARAQLGDGWLDAFKELRNALREKQRDALVDYLISNPPSGQSWTRPDDLFSYYLIDVEMGACMITSRIKQAIGSAQLFAQRSLMGLEPRVKPGSDPGWAQWEWMHSYAIWAGAREIFLWPENWLEPDLRHDSSEPFDRMVSTLQQNPVTTETAEAAFLGYLQEVYTLSRMEVVGVYHQVEKGSGGGARRGRVARDRPDAVEAEPLLLPPAHQRHALDAVGAHQPRHRGGLGAAGGVEPAADAALAADEVRAGAGAAHHAEGRRPDAHCEDVDQRPDRVERVRERQVGRQAAHVQRRDHELQDGPGAGHDRAQQQCQRSRPARCRGDDQHAGGGVACRHLLGAAHRARNALHKRRAVGPAQAVPRSDAGLRRRPRRTALPELGAGGGPVVVEPDSRQYGARPDTGRVRHPLRPLGRAGQHATHAGADQRPLHLQGAAAPEVREVRARLPAHAERRLGRRRPLLLPGRQAQLLRGEAVLARGPLPVLELLPPVRGDAGARAAPLRARRDVHARPSDQAVQPAAARSRRPHRLLLQPLLPADRPRRLPLPGGGDGLQLRRRVLAVQLGAVRARAAPDRRAADAEPAVRRREEVARVHLQPDGRVAVFGAVELLEPGRLLQHHEGRVRRGADPGDPRPARLRGARPGARAAGAGLARRPV